MRAIWALCACAACLTALAATQVSDFPILVILTAIVMMAVSWL